MAVRNRTAKSISAFFCQQFGPHMMMLLLPLSAGGKMQLFYESSSHNSLCMNAKDITQSLWLFLHIYKSKKQKICCSFSWFDCHHSLIDIPVSAGIKDFCNCVDETKKKLYCQQPLLTKLQTKPSHHNVQVYNSSVPSLFFPTDWNFYDTTWWILLGASFKCYGGGIRRRTQQTPSCLSKWEEKERVRSRWILRCLR